MKTRIASTAITSRIADTGIRRNQPRFGAGGAGRIGAAVGTPWATGAGGGGAAAGASAPQNDASGSHCLAAGVGLVTVVSGAAGAARVSTLVSLASPASRSAFEPL